MKTNKFFFAVCLIALACFAKVEAQTLNGQIYCHLCDEQLIVKSLPADFQSAKNRKLQWALDTPKKGRLTLIELSGPCEPVRIIWQSRRTNLRSAVAEFIKEVK